MLSYKEVGRNPESSLELVSSRVLSTTDMQFTVKPEDRYSKPGF